MDNKKKIIIAAALVIIIAGLVLTGYFYWKKSGTDQAQTPASGDPINNAVTQGVLPSINPESNPLEKFPDINPANTANPFKTAKTNPFQ